MSIARESRTCWAITREPSSASTPMRSGRRRLSVTASASLGIVAPAATATPVAEANCRKRRRARRVHVPLLVAGHNVHVLSTPSPLAALRRSQIPAA